VCHPIPYLGQKFAEPFRELGSVSVILQCGMSNYTRFIIEKAVVIKLLLLF